MAARRAPSLFPISRMYPACFSDSAAPSSATHEVPDVRARRYLLPLRLLSSYWRCGACVVVWGRETCLGIGRSSLVEAASQRARQCNSVPHQPCQPQTTTRTTSPRTSHPSADSPHANRGSQQHARPPPPTPPSSSPLAYVPPRYSLTGARTHPGPQWFNTPSTVSSAKNTFRCDLYALTQLYLQREYMQVMKKGFVMAKGEGRTIVGTEDAEVLDLVMRSALRSRMEPTEELVVLARRYIEHVSVSL